MGRKVGYAYLLRRLNSLWRPKGRMELIALDNDYFLVKFGIRDDLEGSWMILDHYLIVKEWVPNFDPLTDTTKKVLVWVRFPSLPVEYYNLLCLRKVGNKLGRTIRVDHTTSLVSKGKFARVCVEIDITKPLVSRFTLEDRVWHVAYEGIHLVCFSCGLYGHRQNSCPTCPKEGEAEDSAPVTAVEMTVQNHDKGPNVVKARDVSAGRSSLHGSRPYGPWMIATRRERRPQGGQQGQGRPVEGVLQRVNISNNKEKTPATGSRFALLGSREENEDVPNQVAAESNESPQTESRPVGLGGKSRRANVVVNEKQNNERDSPRLELEKGKEPSQGRRTTGSSSRRTAEEDEHVINRGAQGGKVIRSTVIQNGDSIAADVPVNTRPPTDHHEDPPGGVDHEGDVIMDDDSPQTTLAMDGGAASPAV
ncbi:uncharacterized protein LOC116024180 [Ipomoea triloba]|uniref:uncharacterized protein LOC116024180 n=1 Tax=Ipomoea triloba TaxID=35885 RepID=UPI00125D8783|nr:uncharacterized protein LOC116024180 [Ipomoea triloba]